MKLLTHEGERHRIVGNHSSVSAGFGVSQTFIYFFTHCNQSTRLADRQTLASGTKSCCYLKDKKEDALNTTNLLPACIQKLGDCEDVLF